MPESDVPESPLNDHAAESYERGLALRKAGLFKQAIEQFEKATSDPALALKAYAQIGLSQKSCASNHVIDSRGRLSPEKYPSAPYWALVTSVRSIQNGFEKHTS